MKLVIVESPTKAATISRFLENGYQVTSSYGHVRDLPKSKIGIDTEHDFEPSYIIPVKAKKRVTELKKLSAKADGVILATDEDREGEAIAWHLTKALGLKDAQRIVFHEITKPAIEKALLSPRPINENLVNAQQARRILDRLVGYKLSPFLWKKVFRGLSAGRVQSVAVRLIVDREKEIEAFKPEEYWSIKAKFKTDGGDIFEAELGKIAGKALTKLAIKNKSEADKILGDLDGADYIVSNVAKKEIHRSPYPPFTTSTLQQEAANKFRFSAKQTMMLAQDLYERGLITYMRTDSLNLSEESLAAAHDLIKKTFAPSLGIKEARRFKTKSKGAQEAHEAIRPSDPFKTPENTKLEVRQAKLYRLIWRRFIASQMHDAVIDATTALIDAKEYTFRATGSVIKNKGWMEVYETKISEKILPELREKEKLELLNLFGEEHFTEHPPRYSEATLVKTLEEQGIGRPSTYAPTISTIQTRNYVEKNEAKRFVPTEVGKTVSDILVENFPVIVDIGFTAKMEEDFDKIAEGEEKWVSVIREFYEPFHKNLEQKYETVVKKETDEATDEVCDKCGKPMLIKHGRFGKFIACSGFPECKNTKNIKREDKKIGMPCPKCIEGEVIVKFTKRKKMFFGCSRYPACDYASWKNPREDKDDGSNRDTEPA